MKQQVKRAALAYSGGLDISIIIPWLKENYGCEVIAIVANIGQDEELSGIQKKALNAGAAKVFVEDLRSEFVTKHIWPLVKAGAAYEGAYLLGTAIAQPLIARRQIEIALRENADALVHDCAGRGNEQIRFEVIYKELAPQLQTIETPATSSTERPYTQDSNLWHQSHEGGMLENLTEAPHKDLFGRTLEPRSCPEGDSEITLDFERGVPVGLNGRPIPAVQLIEDLNDIGGTNGIGRVDVVEDGIDGVKLRGMYETPGGTLITAAHRELESLVLDRQTRYQKELLAAAYAQLVYDGRWFTLLREAMDAFFEKVNDKITGSVTMRLYKGNLKIQSRRAQP